MVDLLRCEFLKLKRSRMILISFLGALATPVMVFVGAIKFRIEKPGSVITYSSFFTQCNQYMIMLFGLVVYTVIAAYLFSREYSENTLKTILTVPVSKLSFIAGKFIMLLIWILCLTSITWISSIFLAMLSNSVDFSFVVLKKSVVQYFGGALLMYFTLSPFIFLTIWMKGLVAPIIAATTIAMGNVALAGESLAALFPWSSSYLLVTNGIKETGYSVVVVISIIISVSILGIAASIIYFQREDVN